MLKFGKADFSLSAANPARNGRGATCSSAAVSKPRMSSVGSFRAAADSRANSSREMIRGPATLKIPFAPRLSNPTTAVARSRLYVGVEYWSCATRNSRPDFKHLIRLYRKFFSLTSGP